MPDADHLLTRPPKLFGLVLAAGAGARAGGELPKQYQLVAGQPIVAHALAALAGVSRLADLFLVLAPSDARGQALADRAKLLLCGGQSRAQSALNGLHALRAHGVQAHDWVLVHDAARCLVTAAQINALVDACWSDPVGGLLALPLPDTLKVGMAGRVQATAERSDKWLAQTPQMFRLGLLLEALQAAQDHDFQGITDESSALEAQGFAPLLVEGSAQNFKVTYPQDFALANAILKSRGA